LFQGSARARARLRSVLLTLGFCLLLGTAAARAFEPEKTPVKKVPQARWGNLQPASILGDSSYFEFHKDPGKNEPFWFGLDIENGWLFAVSGQGLQTYNINANADEPPLVGYSWIRDVMPQYFQSDEDWFLQEVDAPAGNDTVAAVAGWAQGVSVWNTTDKSSPTVHYQDANVVF